MQKRLKADRRPDAYRLSLARNSPKYATTVVGRNQRGLRQAGPALLAVAPPLSLGPTFRLAGAGAGIQFASDTDLSR